MWQEILGYFETLDKRPVERMAFLVGGLLIFWIIEGAIPLIQPKYKRNKLRHAAVNFGFTIIHLVIHTFLAVIIVILSDWCKKESFGLVYWMNTDALGTILRGLFFFIAIFVSGAPMYAVMIFQTVAVLFTAFTHANISLPKWIDKTMSVVFVSPNMHKVHHHWQQPYTDSNYGLIFSLWDRMFGTFTK